MTKAFGMTVAIAGILVGSWIYVAAHAADAPSADSSKLAAGVTPLAQLLQYMDADKNGKVSKEEFMHYMEADPPEHGDAQNPKVNAVRGQYPIALVESQRRLIEQAAALEVMLENERRLTAQQRNFVTLTSHEFRTPLTVIDAQAQRLIKLKDRINPDDLLERARRIRSAVLRLTGIMDSLLGASPLFDGQALYSPDHFDPVGLLHGVCQLHRDTTRGADIREAIGNLPARVSGDRKLLFATFSNLLSNAIKYSSRGSSINVTASAEMAGEWSVCVRDCGIGIPEADRVHLFERYFRGSNTASVAGSGVGLHLVAMVVSLHGGRIEVESGEAVGSSFTVRLPRSATSAAPSPMSVGLA